MTTEALTTHIAEIRRHLDALPDELLAARAAHPRRTARERQEAGLILFFKREIAMHLGRPDTAK